MVEPANRQPTPEEMERAWVRPRTTNTASNYGRWVHSYQRAIWRLMTIFMVLWFVLVALITASAAVDVIAGLGWGYEAKDVAGGLLMIAMGALTVPFFLMIRSIVSALTRRIYGVEPVETPES